MKKKLLVFCPRAGETSEAWMTRQVVGFADLQASLASWDTGPAIGDYPERITRLHLGKPFTRRESGLTRWFSALGRRLSPNKYRAFGEDKAFIRRCLSAVQPDVVLCQFGYTALRVLDEARALGIPVVPHFHGVDISASLRNPDYVRSLHYAKRYFKHIVVVADYQKQRLESLGFDPRFIQVIPCGVPVADFPARPQTSKAECVFLAVGRLVEKKGPLQILQAFESVAKQVPTSSLLIVGDGPLREKCQEMITEKNLAASVRMLLAQPNSEVKRLMRESDVFLQHSLVGPNGDMEGWPVAVAEAMSSGLPVVATRHAGILDQVVHGSTGFLVEEGDWQGMAKHMETLANSPELRAKMGASSAEKAHAGFDQALMVQRLEKLLLSAAR